VKARAAAALALFSLAGCSDSPGFVAEGTPGQATATDFSQLVAQIQVAVNGNPTGAFVLDSGSPLTFLAAGQTGLSPGAGTADLHAFGMEFPYTPVVAQQGSLVGTFPDGHSLNGIIGGDFMGRFAITFDYEGGRTFLWQSSPGLNVPVPGARTQPALAVPFTLAGGGLGSLPNGEIVSIPKTRILVTASVEGGAPVTMLVDTGATWAIFRNDFLSGLGVPWGPRPTLAGLEVGTFSGPARATLWRIGNLSLTTDPTTGAQGPASVDDLVALTLPDDSLLDQLSAEVGKPVVGLCGDSFLSQFLTTLDYPSDRVLLQPYDDGGIALGHLSGMGFDIGTTTPGSVQVSDVFIPSAASVAGVQVGDTLVQIESLPVTGLSFADVKADLLSFRLWETVPLTFSRGGSDYTVNLQVQPLLADYPPSPFQPSPDEPQVTAAGMVP
jgi:hypothetical protein